ncbi:MAG: sigma-70 family RNA polymerase sigma factor [Bacteroidaceae bacterium]|nr:sigma-70 family RNA polymerase sigma factor [Bacteroidaceae bacterium]
MSLADIALVSQVLIFGNRRAFDTLVRKYQGEVRRFLLTLTAGDEQLTDDLAQETFIKAYTALESYKNRASFGTWLYRIAYNVFYDYIRSRKETCTMDDVTDEVDTCYQVQPTDGHIAADINKAMERLRPEERTCITLHLMEDMPIEKITEITGMPEGTVKSHLARGREKLKTYLRQHGYER